MGKRDLSGDSLLVGVCAGEGEILCGEDCPDSYNISIFEQDGSDSSV